MSAVSPFDVVQSRLAPYKPRESAPGRLRCICPVCGERNPNTLSVGEGHDGAVLVKCFKSGCSVESIAAALGLEMTDLFPPRAAPGAGNGPIKRRRLISASQALHLLDDEATLVAVAAGNIGHGTELTQEDRDRVLQAAGRIAYLREEVMS